MVDRGSVENVIPSDAPHCGTCMYYERATGGSPVMQALGQVHTCLHYKDAVTGEARTVQCVDARGDERLCGAMGTKWREKDAAHVVSASGEVPLADAPRRGRPAKPKANGVAAEVVS